MEIFDDNIGDYVNDGKEGCKVSRKNSNDQLLDLCSWLRKRGQDSTRKEIH